MLLLDHRELPFGLSHEVFYELVILSINLPIPAGRAGAWTFGNKRRPASYLTPFKLSSGKLGDGINVWTFGAGSAQHCPVKR